jgi:hypothetical protein
VEEARQKLDHLIDDFIQAAAAWNAAHAQDEEEDDEANPFEAYVQRPERDGLIEAPPPAVHAMRVSTGVARRNGSRQGSPVIFWRARPPVGRRGHGFTWYRHIGWAKTLPNISETMG